MRIYGQPIHSHAPHVRLVNAVWNSGTRPLPSQVNMGVWDSAISGIVLAYDTITKEYRVYWGTFSHHNPGAEGLDSILEHAQHIATWGYKFPMSAAQALFGDLSEPPGFAQKDEV